MSNKIKLNQPASVNGGAYKFSPGQVVIRGDVPDWVIDLLLGGGYADEIRERVKKQEAKHGSIRN